MKGIYNFIISKIKFLIGVIILFTAVYLILLVLNLIYESATIQLFKDIMGVASFGLSISLAITLNVNVTNYKADQQYFVEGNLYQSGEDSTKSIEQTEKNNILKVVNKIANDTITLSNILRLNDTHKPMGFVPLNTQRDIIYNQRKFLYHIDELRNKLSDGVLTIKDDDFTNVLNDCITIANQIKDAFDSLYKASQSPRLNQITSLRNTAVEKLNAFVQQLNEKNIQLKTML